MAKNLPGFYWNLAIWIALVTLTECKPKPDPISSKIYGGIEAYRGEFPYIVSVQASYDLINYHHICGGTIVSPNYVITAAHCILQPEYTLRVVAGAHNITRFENSQQYTYISKAAHHSEFDNEKFLFDIAVLEVSPPFNLSDRVKVVQLPPDNVDPTGNCQIAGWGTTETSNGEISSVLLKAELPIVAKPVCRALYPETYHKETQICAGRPEGGVDACGGDTGGPLICDDMGYKYFAGIASYGYYCARAGYPGVYTQVAKFIQWIINPNFNLTEVNNNNNNKFPHLRSKTHL